MMDYYEILGVSRDASAEDIKKAYRKLSKEYHPDKHKGDKVAEEKYKQINRAYEGLTDPKKRQAYDQFGSEDGPQFQGFGRGGSGGFGGFEGFESAGDIFETFFGGGRSGRREAAQEGSAMEVRMTLTLEEAFHGVRKTVRITKEIVCEACGGGGAEKGSTTVTCSACKGTGQIVRSVRSFFGVIEQGVLCDTCKGSGRVPETPCKACRGEGRKKGTEDVTVEVPPGISDGQSLRLRGKGGAGRQGAQTGDLYVRIQVHPDARFERDGDDLRTGVTIPVVDAVLGKDVSLTTFEGALTVKIPSGTQPQQILRVKGKGMPVLSSSRRGDLYVRVIVEVPGKVGRRERELWEELRGG